MTFAQIYRRDLSLAEQNGTEFSWESEDLPPFNELILSWNGLRPVGFWTFFVRLKKDSWSSWLKYAEWGLDRQKTFKSFPTDSFASSYQDAVTAKEDCTAFQIRVQSEHILETLHSLHVCLSRPSHFEKTLLPALKPVFLNEIPFQSQMVLDHPRHRDFCSPTSTSTAINYLLQSRAVDPVQFARSVRDEEFDIYGNWILNTAEAYERLGCRYRVYVKRLNGFESLHRRLLEGCPVIASVKGTIPGAPQPYPQGHLICVTGFDPESNQVHCADPAFPNSESVSAKYNLNDFLTAWGIRRNLAYIFEKIC